MQNTSFNVYVWFCYKLTLIVIRTWKCWWKGVIKYFSLNFRQVESTQIEERSVGGRAEYQRQSWQLLLQLYPLAMYTRSYRVFLLIPSYKLIQKRFHPYYCIAILLDYRMTGWAIKREIRISLIVIIFI